MTPDTENHPGPAEELPPQAVPGDRPQDADLSRVVTFMSKMEVVEPGLVRAIRCYHVLADCGVALRCSGSSDLLASVYSKSQMVEEIEEFWSHSWHTPAWKKILCLMILKNSLPATLLSTLVSFLAALCSYLDILPPVLMPASTSCRVCGVETYLWSQFFGMISFCFLLIFWRNRRRIFLDCGCIDQRNTDRKVKAIRSIGGILKQSQRLLLLWDPTYVERFWCTFELAAFVKSHGGSKAVQIQPILLGHFFLALYFSVFVVALVTASFAAQNVRGVEATGGTAVAVFVVMYLAIAECRRYYHSLDVLNEQLLTFKVCNTKCWCCSCDHLTPSGQVLPCDREIVSRCLNEWFGSVEGFETAAMAELASASKAQMGRQVFPWSMLLSSTVPVVWLCLDMAVSYEKDGQEGARNHWLVVSIAYWLGSLPITAAWIFWVAKTFRKPIRRSKCCDRLATVLVLASAIPVFLVAFALPSLMDYQKWIRNMNAQVATAAGILAPIGILLWQPLRCWRKVHDDAGKGEDQEVEEAEDDYPPSDRPDELGPPTFQL